MCEVLDKSGKATGYQGLNNVGVIDVAGGANPCADNVKCILDLNFSGSIGPLLIDTTIVVENNSLNHLYEISGLNFIVENVTLDPNNWILKEVSYTTNGIDNLLPKNVNVQLAYPNPFNSNLKLSFYVHPVLGNQNICLLYTSDAADE